MRHRNKTFTRLAALTLLAAASTHASAALTLVDEVDLGGTGIGAVNTVLTIQGRPGASFESGSVGLDPATQMQVITGDAKTGASQTSLRTFGELGLTSASDLRVVLNAAEPGNALDITLNDLVLTVYDTSGGVLFESGPFTDTLLNQTLSGMGQSGFVFGLDAGDVAAASALFSGNFADYRVGLTAQASGFSGGPETFFVYSAGVAAPIPEPTTTALLLGGLGMLAFLGTRRRREDEGRR